MKIAVTGASGFIGRNLVAELSGRGHSLRLLSHRRQPAADSGHSVEIVEANVHDSDSLSEAFKNIEVVYHLVGIIAETRRLTFDKTVVEGTYNVVSACREQGVKRLIYLSAAGASADARSKYHQSKWKAEEAVRNSGLDYTIFRPSVVFGEGDGFVGMLVGMIGRFPLIPVIGNGRYELQPVYINDLTKVMSDTLENRQTVNRIFEIGGPEVLEYRQIITILKRVLNKRRGSLYLPLWLMKINAAILEKIMKPAPVTKDQLIMLEAGNRADNSRLIKIFDIKLTSFEDGIRKYMR
ncbi:MAG: NAD-dependent dehydratase [candidate division Zixibacteria bacterium HGW-Zixibacteria-1]|nr:MAG: NAD-dependent dehydratase [candidate division Zixibacteria bacterium HGW-Zixibacteria-1]